MNLNRIKQSTCLQQDSSDCGVASLLTIIKYYEGEDTIDNLRELSGTNVGGTTLLGLYDAAIQKGLKAESFKGNIEYLKNIDTPHILHIKSTTGMLHYIVLWGYKDGLFYVTDPAIGFVKWNIAELEKQWESKVCMVLQTSDNFIKSTTLKEAKKKWIIDIIKKDWPIYIVSIILGTVSSILGISTSLFSQKLLDKWIPEQNIKLIVIAILFLLVLLSIRIFVEASRNLLMCKQSKKLNINLMNKFFKRILHKPLSFFEYRKTGDIISRLGDIPRIQNVICSVVGGNLILNVLLLFSALFAVFYYSSTLALFLFFSIPILYCIIVRFNRKIKIGQYNVMSTYANVETNFISAIQGIRLFKVNERYKQLNSLNQFIYSEHQEASLSLGKLSIKLSVYYGFVTLFVTIAILLYGSISVINEILTIGEFTAIISLTTMIMPCISELSIIPILINEAKVAFDRVYDISINNNQNLKENNINVTGDNLSILLNSLNFRFICNTNVIDNLSFEFKQGNIYGIIGESGAGKSTLCKLIEGSYQPNSGNITIYSPRKENIISSASQEVHIINGTIFDNICLYAESEESLKKAIETCTKYDVEPFLKKFSMGLQTIIGDSGVSLSGGEKQMIGLIRILYRDSNIIILDEPTAAMDSEMEKWAMETLTKIKKDRIIIMVSHKFNLLKKYADKICIMKEGKFSHVGSHSELMKTNNLYSKFWLETL